MAEKIRIDVCIAETDFQRGLLVEASKRYWKDKGYRLLNDEIGPDYIKVYEGAIVGKGDDERYRPVTKYVKEPADEPTVLLFIKN